MLRPLAAALVAACLLAAADAAPRPKPRSGAKPAASPAPARLAPRDVLAKLEHRFRSVKDYQVVMESEVTGPDETSTGEYRIWFLRPDMIRIKVERGEHRGSEISVTESGKVRARPGGFLGKVVTTTMEKTDPRLRGPRGGYGWESNFPTYYRKLRERLRTATSASAALAPNERDLLHLTVSYRHPERRTAMREVWIIDSRSWLLVGRDGFEDGRRAERIRFHGFEENVGLDPDFFDL